MTIEERFWAKVNKTETCWLWTGSTIGAGYGRFGIDRKNRWYAHRFSYELAHGPVPDGFFICHRCDVKRCVRVEHLFLGTHQDNMDDMVAKGRWSTGDQRRNTTLTAEQVREMRARYAAGGVGYTALARAYGISHSSVGLVIQGKRWRHLLDSATT